MTFVAALNEALVEEFQHDENVFLIGEDVGNYGGIFRVTVGLQSKFGKERVRDTPISEAAFVGAALGAAMTGKRPIVEILFADFSFVAMDQIVNQIAKARYMSGGNVKVPVVIRMQGGGYKGQAAQHSQSIEAVFAHFPGLLVVSPSTPADAKGLLKTAIRDENPVVFIEHKMIYNEKGEVPSEEHFVPFGKAAVRREGKDVTLLGYSYAMGFVNAAADRLASEGIEAEVIDLRSINPLDMATIATSILKTHRCVIVHEAHTNCGFGAEITARIQEQLFDELDAPILRVGGVDVPVPYAVELESAMLPSVDRICAAVRSIR